MYYTVQIHLRIDKEQQQVLLAYEKEYLKALEDLKDKMVSHKKEHRFSYYHYSQCVVKSSHWMLYSIALKMAKAEKQNKKSVYRRSGTWSPNSFRISDHELILQYGDTFICKEAKFLVALNSKHQFQLQNGKKLRLDLVHDENCWYCNILMEAKDTQKNCIKYGMMNRNKKITGDYIC